MMQRLILLLALAALSFSCGNHPSQHNPQRYGTVRVWYGEASDWSSQQVEQLDLQLVAMRVVGPDFVRASSALESDVSVRHWDSLSSTCAFGVERYTFASHVIEIDPACTAGFLEYRTAFGHGLLHHLGLTHVCRAVDQLPGAQCSPVGTGIAMHNPRIRYSDAEITTSTYEGDVPPVDPTSLDLAEFVRVHP